MRFQIWNSISKIFNFLLSIKYISNYLFTNNTHGNRNRKTIWLFFDLLYLRHFGIFKDWIWKEIECDLIPSRENPQRSLTSILGTYPWHICHRFTIWKLDSPTLILCFLKNKGRHVTLKYFSILLKIIKEQRLFKPRSVSSDGRAGEHRLRGPRAKTPPLQSQSTTSKHSTHIVCACSSLHWSIKFIFTNNM